MSERYSLRLQYALIVASFIAHLSKANSQLQAQLPEYHQKDWVEREREGQAIVSKHNASSTMGHIRRYAS